MPHLGTALRSISRFDGVRIGEVTGSGSKNLDAEQKVGYHNDDADGAVSCPLVAAGSIFWSAGQVMGDRGGT